MGAWADWGLSRVNAKQDPAPSPGLRGDAGWLLPPCLPHRHCQPLKADGKRFRPELALREPWSRGARTWSNSSKSLALGWWMVQMMDLPPWASPFSRDTTWKQDALSRPLQAEGT